jgi:hypothetical protein
MNDQARSFFSELFQFDRLMGKSLIKIVYFLGLVGIAVWALVALAAGLGAAAYDSGGAVVGIFAAAMILVFGTLFWRLSCELWIVLFKIYDELVKANCK